MNLPLPQHAERRRRAGLRSLAIGTTAAMAGGIAVFALQYGLGRVSAGYPPVVHALFCEAEGQADRTVLGMAGDDSAVAPVAEFVAGSVVTCRIEAPGADYGSWSLVGGTRAIRSGPLDPTEPCQSSDAFSSQDAAWLRLSTCQRIQVERPGLYLLSVTVMSRGQSSVDRVRLAIRVVPAPAAPAPSTAPRSERLAVSLRLPAQVTGQARQADLSAAFSEHGLLPQSRDFERVVYRLDPREEFVSTTFRARSAANASAVQLAYVPASRAVVARFTLRSGPVVDRWRGWVSGTVDIRLRLREAAQEVALTEVALQVPGRAELPLPDGIDASRAMILLHRPETATVIELAPGGSAALDLARVTARLQAGVLVLEAEPAPQTPGG